MSLCYCSVSQLFFSATQNRVKTLRARTATTQLNSQKNTRTKKNRTQRSRTLIKHIYRYFASARFEIAAQRQTQ